MAKKTLKRDFARDSHQNQGFVAQRVNSKNAILRCVLQTVPRVLLLQAAFAFCDVDFVRDVCRFGRIVLQFTMCFGTFWHQNYKFALCFGNRASRSSATGSIRVLAMLISLGTSAESGGTFFTLHCVLLQFGTQTVILLCVLEIVLRVLLLQAAFAFCDVDFVRDVCRVRRAVFHFTMCSGTLRSRICESFNFWITDGCQTAPAAALAEMGCAKP